MKGYVRRETDMQTRKGMEGYKDGRDRDRDKQRQQQRERDKEK